MKIYLFVWLLLSMFISACRKDVINSASTPDAIGVKQYHFLEKSGTMIHEVQVQAPGHEPEDHCALPNCDQIFDALALELQAQANASCRTAWNCIDCCMNGQVLFLTFYAKPNHPDCCKEAATPPRISMTPPGY